jgi:hypothetical protein
MVHRALVARENGAANTVSFAEAANDLCVSIRAQRQSTNKYAFCTVSLFLGLTTREFAIKYSHGSGGTKSVSGR